MAKANPKKMTPTSKEMAKNIIMMLDKRARKSKKNNAWFMPKEFVSFCKGMGINNHKARSFIKTLHIDGHLNREAVNKVSNKYTPNPDSVEMMGIIESLIIPNESDTKSKNMPVGTKLTEKEAAVAQSIQEYIEFAKTLSPTAVAALGDNESFKAKNAINHLIRHSVCKHANARYYIRYLHGRGFLERVSRGVYRIAGKKTAKTPTKVTPLVQKVSKVSHEIEQVKTKCLKITYGEKQIMNTINALQEEVNDLSQSIRGIHMILAEMGAAMGEKIQEKLTLQNLFKTKSIPKTQRIKG